MNPRQREELDRIIAQMLSLRTNIQNGEPLEIVESKADFYFTCGKLYAYTEKYKKDLILNDNIPSIVITHLAQTLEKIHEISMEDRFKKAASKSGSVAKTEKE